MINQPVYKKLPDDVNGDHVYKIMREYWHVLRPGQFPDCSDEWISIRNGVITVKNGYIYDGPSGPTPDTTDAMAGTLVHDGLYGLMKSRTLDIDYRRAADREMLHMLKGSGMPWTRRIRWFAGVRMGGGIIIRKAWRERERT